MARTDHTGKTKAGKFIAWIRNTWNTVLGEQNNPTWSPGMPIPNYALTAPSPYGFPPVWSLPEVERNRGVPPGGVTIGDVAEGALRNIFPKTADKVTGYMNSVRDFLNRKIETDTEAGRAGLFALPYWLIYVGAGLFLFLLLRKR